ncbi:MAG: hydrogenase maturation protease [bacterium]
MPQKNYPQVLIAGVGNVLRQDDGFGVEVARQLQKRADLPDCVKVVETGIGGISLVQELYDGYETLLLVDVVSNEGNPGQIFMLEAKVGDIADWPIQEKRDFLADMHYTDPNRALMLAKALDVLPRSVYIVGCQPLECGDFKLGLSEEIQNAVPRAVEHIMAWISAFYQSQQSLES